MYATRARVRALVSPRPAQLAPFHFGAGKIGAQPFQDGANLAGEIGAVDVSATEVATEIATGKIGM